MSKWRKITLFKFQQIEEIQNNKRFDELEKVLFTACEIFDLTETQVNEGGVKLASRLMRKVNAIFKDEMTANRPKRIGRYMMQYDVAAVTFGQYIEMAFFFQGYLTQAHRILASMSRPIGRRYRTEGHPDRADYFLGQSVEKTFGAFKAIAQSFEFFNHGYKGLFGLDEGPYSDDAERDPFNRRYGWIYSASAVAEYQCIPLKDVYALPVRQAFNDLMYLKEKLKYEVRERDRLENEHKMRRHA